MPPRCRSRLTTDDARAGGGPRVVAGLATKRHAGRRWFALSCVALTLACDRHRAPLQDLPRVAPGRFGAVMAIRADQCDANVGTLVVFARDEIRRGISLNGV